MSSMPDTANVNNNMNNRMNVHTNVTRDCIKPCKRRHNVLNILERQSLATASLSILSANIGTTVEMSPEVVLCFNILATVAHIWFIARIMKELWEDFALYCYMKFKPAAEKYKSQDDTAEGKGGKPGQAPEQEDPLDLMEEDLDSLSDGLDEAQNGTETLVQALLREFRYHVDQLASFLTFGNVTRLGASLEHPWLDFKKYIAARRLHEKKTIQISLDDVKRQIMVLGIEGVSDGMLDIGQTLAGYTVGMAKGVSVYTLTKAMAAGSYMKPAKSTLFGASWALGSYTSYAQKPARDLQEAEKAAKSKQNDDEVDDEGPISHSLPDTDKQTATASTLPPRKVPRTEAGEPSRWRKCLSSMRSRLRRCFCCCCKSEDATSTPHQDDPYSSRELKRTDSPVHLIKEEILGFAPPAQLLLRSFIAASKLKRMPCESLLYLLTQACETMYAASQLDGADLRKIAALGEELYQEFEGKLPPPPSTRDVVKFIPSLQMLESLRGRVIRSAKHRKKVLTVSELDIYLHGVREDDFKKTVRDLQDQLAVEKPFPVCDVAVGIGAKEMKPRPAPRRTFIPPAETPAQLHGIVERYGKEQKKLYAKEFLGADVDQDRRENLASRMMYQWFAKRRQLKAHGLNFHTKLRPHDLVAQSWHRREVQLEMSESSWVRLHPEEQQESIRVQAEVILRSSLAGSWGDARDAITRDSMLGAAWLSKETKECLHDLSHPGTSVDVLQVVARRHEMLCKELPGMLVSASKVWVALDRHRTSLEAAAKIPPSIAEEERQTLASDLFSEVIGVFAELDPESGALPILHALKSRVVKHSWRQEWVSCTLVSEKDCGICGRHGQDGPTSKEGWEVSHLDWLLYMLNEARDESTSRCTRHGTTYLTPGELSILREWKAKISVGADGGQEASLTDLSLVPAMLDKNTPVGEWVLRHALARRAATEIAFSKVLKTYQRWTRVLQAKVVDMPQCWFARVLEFAEGAFPEENQQLVSATEVWQVIDRLAESCFPLVENVVVAADQAERDEYFRSLFQAWEHILKGASTAQKVRLQTEAYFRRDDELCKAAVESVLSAVQGSRAAQEAMKAVRRPQRVVMVAMLVKQVTEVNRQLSDWAYAAGMRREHELLAVTLLRKFSVRQDWGTADRLDNLVLRTPRLAVPYSYELNDSRVHKLRMYNSLWEFRLSTNMVNKDEREVNKEWRLMDKTRDVRENLHVDLKPTNVAEALRLKSVERLRRLWQIVEAEATYVKSKAQAQPMATFVVETLNEALTYVIDALPESSRSDVAKRLKDLPPMVCTGILMRLERREPWERQFEFRDGRVMWLDQTQWILNQIQAERQWVRHMPLSQLRKQKSDQLTPKNVGEAVFDGDLRTKYFVGYYNASEGDSAPVHMWNHIWKATTNTACQTKDDNDDEGQAPEMCSRSVEANLMSDMDDFREVGGLADTSFDLVKQRAVLAIARSKTGQAIKKKEGLESALTMFSEHTKDANASTRRVWQTWLEGILKTLDADKALQQSKVLPPVPNPE
mmetsp:Transcript_54803/g.123125  ORF Transcript_54803/g.123125 Transcript_54803/m.123125 type:complete len:1518 (-) Transcript_54803:76-4629(-)